MFGQISSLGLRLTARRSQLVEAAVVVLVVVALGVEASEGGRPLGPGPLVVVFGSCLVLMARHRAPIGVLAVVVAARLFIMWSTGSGVAMLPLVAVALYSVARNGDRRSGLLASSTAALVMALIAGALGDDGYLVEVLEEGAQAFLPIAVGDAARTREDRVNDMVEAEAEARVQAERIRIARDLHDVVAHGLSTIAIQSGVAARLLEADRGDDQHPGRGREQAKEALEIINATGRHSLEELRSMVGALRSTDVDAHRPTPADPNDVSDVIAAATRAGVVVSYDSTGRFPDDVGDAVVVAIHRIMQEALMNVARHVGDGPATVSLDHGGDHVRLSVTNEAPAGTPLAVPSTGVGIVGMRERAESVGGSLDAEPTAGGGFAVTATVPYTRTSP
jgi:signal transduction histidine kinase